MEFERKNVKRNKESMIGWQRKYAKKKRAIEKERKGDREKLGER